MGTGSHRRNHLIWIGVVVTFLAAVSYFTFFAGFPALRDFPWVNLPLVGLGVLVSAWAVRRAYGRAKAYRGRILSVVGLALSGTLAAGFMTYVFWITYLLPSPTQTALDLVQAPDFALVSMNGETVRLGDLRGSKVVLVFYRGFW
jgi:hypothetical protein